MNAKNRLFRQAHRQAAHIQIRALDDKQGRFQARVMHYNVVDDYQTEFAPGLFRESLEARLPRVVWAHDWAEPLGRYIDYEDGQEYLDLIGEFDNFDDVPRARQAYSQLKSGTIDEFSVGFMPLDGEPAVRDGRDVFRFTRARLDEVSLVLAGAVPNTQLLAVRQRDIDTVRSPVLTVPKDFAAQVILDLHSGTVDIADALQSIKHAAEVEDEQDDDSDDQDEQDEQDEQDDDPDGQEDGAGDDAGDGDGGGDDDSVGDGVDDSDVDSDPPVEPDFSDLGDIDSILQGF